VETSQRVPTGAFGECSNSARWRVLTDARARSLSRANACFRSFGARQIDGPLEKGSRADCAYARSHGMTRSRALAEGEVVAFSGCVVAGTKRGRDLFTPMRHASNCHAQPPPPPPPPAWSNRHRCNLDGNSDWNTPHLADAAHAFRPWASPRRPASRTRLRWR